MFLISFSRVMWFSVFMSCISLVKLVPKYVTHFDAIEKQLFLNFSLQVVHCLCVEIHLSFICWSCILWLCWIYLLALQDSRSFRVYLYIGLCHLWIEKVLLLPFNLGTFYFFFMITWLGPLIQCWIEEVCAGVLALFPM